MQGHRTKLKRKKEKKKKQQNRRQSVVAGALHSHYIGSTENAGPENGGPKKDERTENAGLKMKDQMSGVENAGPENAGPKH